MQLAAALMWLLHWLAEEWWSCSRKVQCEAGEWGKYELSLSLDFCDGYHWRSYCLIMLTMQQQSNDALLVCRCAWLREQIKQQARCACLSSARAKMADTDSTNYSCSANACSHSVLQNRCSISIPSLKRR
jgi:hypothetical protein